MTGFQGRGVALSVDTLLSMCSLHQKATGEEVFTDLCHAENQLREVSLVSEAFTPEVKPALQEPGFQGGVL